MVLFNTEIRFPLPFGFGLVTFLDAGNAWLLNKNIMSSKRTDPITGARVAAEQTTGIKSIGANGLRYGAGAGIRYDTPVGPLRLDYGFKLNPIPGESKGMLHFTIGQAF